VAATKVTFKQGFLLHFSSKTIGFHRQGKLLELSFLPKNLQMVEPGAQNWPQSQSVCQCPALKETPAFKDIGKLHVFQML